MSGTATPVVEFSTVVPAAQQAQTNSSAVGALNSFISFVGGLAQPVAQVVAAAQRPQVTATTAAATGEGPKTAAPSVGVPALNNATNPRLPLYLAGGVAAVLVLVLLLRNRSA